MQPRNWRRVNGCALSEGFIRWSIDGGNEDDDGEEAGHAGQGGVVDEAVSQAGSAADHLCADRREQAEDSADHQAHNDHWKGQGEADFGEDLKGGGAVGSGQRDFRPVGPPEAGGGVDHDHGAHGQGDGDDARGLPEPELEDEQGHQRQHRGCDQDEDIGGDHLFRKRELGDDCCQQNAGDGANGIAGAQLLEGDEQVGPQQREGSDQRPEDFAGWGKDVGGDLERPHHRLDYGDDSHGQAGNDGDLGAGEVHRGQGGPVQGAFQGGAIRQVFRFLLRGWHPVLLRFPERPGRWPA